MKSGEGRGGRGMRIATPNPSVTGASAGDTSPCRGGKARRLAMTRGGRGQCRGGAKCPLGYVPARRILRLRRGRRPRRPVVGHRPQVGGRFVNRPYGGRGMRIATPAQHAQVLRLLRRQELVVSDVGHWFAMTGGRGTGKKAQGTGLCVLCETHSSVPCARVESRSLTSRSAGSSWPG